MKKILIVLLLTGIVFVSGCVRCEEGGGNTVEGFISKYCGCSGTRISDFCIGRCEECNCSAFYELENDTTCISHGPCDSVEFKTDYKLCGARDDCDFRCRHGNYCTIEFELDKNYNGIIDNDEMGLHCWDDPINVKCNINCNV